MSVDRPTREDLSRGMTVEIEQTNAENADEAEPLRGEIAKVLSEEHTEPGGVKVQLQSGITGRVKRIAPNE
ncbi:MULTISPECIES: DUF2196 domain-containing protein [unclassified Haladaptatus]|uniref:DUF2196 domain-containing protein n=1 Tax=unclassified Haladaptatus TaxID=2622732 RepID=UPI0007B475E7|nr:MULTISPECIES: DUF2196 domain-containing protein [unclassified Haladaptatus]KZN26444.1 hypothetical protein A4G99_20535 [Haladaptatus sp. R4]MCO8244213.1 YwbE family protein [Haladaptatus sp. AB643]MCO8256017.1 YwbE family protein [Haladaptatus sp. AB618]